MDINGQFHHGGVSYSNQQQRFHARVRSLFRFVPATFLPGNGNNNKVRVGVLLHMHTPLPPTHSQQYLATVIFSLEHRPLGIALGLCEAAARLLVYV